MVFTHDTEVGLQSAEHLINTAPNTVSSEGKLSGKDTLETMAQLDAFAIAEEITGSRTHRVEELEASRRMRSRLREIWLAPESQAVDMVNELLSEANALPQLVRHDAWDWHLHATASAAPLAQRMGVEAAMAFVDVIRSKELVRLKVCEADDCQAVVLDLSKNRSKRYCETGNCGNRAHVAAYRRRKSGQA